MRVWGSDTSVPELHLPFYSHGLKPRAAVHAVLVLVRSLNLVDSAGVLSKNITIGLFCQALQVNLLREFDRREGDLP